MQMQRSNQHIIEQIHTSLFPYKVRRVAEPNGKLRRWEYRSPERGEWYNGISEEKSRELEAEYQENFVVCIPSKHRA